MQHQDREFLDFVKSHRHVGYGRMLQIISEEWYRAEKREGYPVSGVLVANACLGFLSKSKQEAFARQAESGDSDET
jgi:hypothetical protein